MSSPERCIAHGKTNYPASYKFLLEQVPVGIVMVNTRLRITEFNPRIQRITGHSEHNALNRNCRELLQGELCDSHCPLRISLCINKPRLNEETSIQNREGKSIPVRLSSAALLDLKGMMLAGLEIYEDLRHARAFERERNNSVSVFAHDIKSPIISIEDQGMGIDAADLPFLFEPFWRGKAGVRREGFGLGLSGAKAIIDRYGGDIQVKSEVRKGSVFTVVFPRTRITPQE